MIYGYFDGSATHDYSRLFSLCGFIGDPRIWDDFDAEWQKILDKPEWPRRPIEFHMYDCVHAYGEFEGWNLAQRLAIFGDLSGLIADSNVMAIGSLCLVDALKSCTEAERIIFAKGGLESPLDFCFHLAVQLAISKTLDYGRIHEPPIRDKLALIFDEEPPYIELRFHELFNHHCLKDQNGDILTSITFDKSHTLSPLQAADILAYTSYYWQLKQLFPSESDFEFPIIPGFLRLIQNVAAVGGIVHHQAIRTLLYTRAINEANKPYALSPHSID